MKEVLVSTCDEKLTLFCGSGLLSSFMDQLIDIPMTNYRTLSAKKQINDLFGWLYNFKAKLLKELL